MEILNDEKVWNEIADCLCEIQEGADSHYSEMKNGTIGKMFIKQQTDQILTIIALKVFPKYIEQMKKDLKLTNI